MSLINSIRHRCNTFALRLSAHSNNQSGNSGLTPAYSLYLDFWRALAAVLVLIQHATSPLYSSGAFPRFPYGHEAVVIFFVLSGLVIAYIHDEREKTARVFIMKRIARIQPVLIFAIVVSLLLDTVGNSISPQSYEGAHYDPENPVSQVVNTFFYLGENWFNHVRLGSNGVVWSLNFEFLYYIIFACFAFASTWRSRLVLLTVTALFAGPRILLLLPCWLVGVCAFRFRIRLKRWTFPTMCASLFLFLAWFIMRPLGDFRPIVFPLLGVPLYNSDLFLGDFVLSLLFGIHLVLARNVMNSYILHARYPFWRHIISILAGSSFTLYLCHQPMFNFFAAVSGMPTSSSWIVCIMIALVLVICVTLGKLVEPLKKPVFHFLVETFPERRLPTNPPRSTNTH